MKRDDAIKGVAMTLSLDRGFDWQRHPSWAQQKRQDRFIRQATSIVGEVERAMVRFEWSEE